MVSGVSASCCEGAPPVLTLLLVVLYQPSIYTFCIIHQGTAEHIEHTYDAELLRHLSDQLPAVHTNPAVASTVTVQSGTCAHVLACVRVVVYDWPVHALVRLCSCRGG